MSVDLCGSPSVCRLTKLKDVLPISKAVPRLKGLIEKTSDWNLSFTQGLRGFRLSQTITSKYSASPSPGVIWKPGWSVVPQGDGT